MAPVVRRVLLRLLETIGLLAAMILLGYLADLFQAHFGPIP